MHIRPYRSSDCPALAEPVHQTVHAVNARDYSPKQLDAWADGRVELAAWDASFRAHDTRVAVEGGELRRLAIWADGYLDRLYVHRDWQGGGWPPPSATPSPPPASPMPPSPPGPSLSGAATAGSQQVERPGGAPHQLCHGAVMPAAFPPCVGRHPVTRRFCRVLGRPAPPPFFPVQAGLA